VVRARMMLPMVAAWGWLDSGLVSFLRWGWRI
jgi:hypothetical protein